MIKSVFLWRQKNIMFICIVCNREFIYNNGSYKFCNNECHEKHNRERWKKYYELNKERIKNRVKKYAMKPEVKRHIKEYSKKYREENKEAIRYSKQKCVDKNPEKYHLIKIKWSDKNREHLNDKSRKFSRTKKGKDYKKIYRENYKETRNKKTRYRLKNDIMFRLNANISSHIKSDLKTKEINKKRRHWESFVPFTKEELKIHIENLFSDGMNWDNYGKWHIDHIIPKAFFKYNSTDDVEFKYCWSLQNLQPLWGNENMSKRTHVPGFKRVKGEYIKI